MSTTFAQLGVPDSITRALEAHGIIEPFAIQAATITDALDGRDICGRAPTGSGKTLAFGIPLVATVERAEPRRPRALVLAPTRELAEQICTELRTFAGKVRIGVIYGGVGYGPQLKALREGVDILVACPGRLEDLLDQGALKLDAVSQVVLDEADRMADMGFMPAVRRLLDKTADQRQTVLFSATLDGDVAKLTRDHQTNPVRHEVGDETPDITAATHLFWTVDRHERVELFHSPLFKAYSHLAEGEGDFRSRLTLAAREARDEAVEKMRDKYERKLRTKADQLERAELAIDREQAESTSATWQVGASVIGGILGGLLGGRRSRRSVVSQGTRAYKQRSDVVRARKKARGLEKDIAELEAELREEIDELTARYDPDQAKLETLSVKPYRKDIDVELVALLWLPFDERGEKAW